MDGDTEPLQLHDVRPEDRRTHELLERVISRLDTIDAKLGDQQRLVPPLSRLHLTTAMPLLVEISDAIGDLAWSARELFNHAVGDAKLRAAIGAAVGAMDVGATRRLGRLLARCEGVALPDRYRVERLDDRAADCAIWRVLRI